MPANPLNGNQFLLNTDYPLDKVSGYGSGEFTVAAFDSTTYEIAHELGYTPLYIVKWSTDPTFATSFDEIGVSFNFVQLTAQTDIAKLYLFSLNLTASPVTIYYRVIYFMPTDVDLEAVSTQFGLDAFTLNTDFNYTKVFTEGVVPSGNATVDHNLGYYPQVEAWYVRGDGRCVHLVANDVSSTGTQRVVVTPTQIILNAGSFNPAVKWHYKIYLDVV